MANRLLLKSHMFYQPYLNFENSDSRISEALFLHIHKYVSRQFHYSYWWRARHVGVFKRLIKTQLKLFKTSWLRVLGAQAHVRQFKLRGMQFIAISNIA